MGSVGRPRSKQARRAVLTAATDIVRERGYAALTIEGIAARAGVAKTTIYRSWPNRAAVIMEAAVAETAVPLAVPDTGSGREGSRRSRGGAGPVSPGPGFRPPVARPPAPGPDDRRR